MKKYPKQILEIVKEAPIAYGIVLLSDYTEKKITIRQAKKDWEKFKNEQILRSQDTLTD